MILKTQYQRCATRGSRRVEHVLISDCAGPNSSKAAVRAVDLMELRMKMLIQLNW
jgi:hypothetical protein